MKRDFNKTYERNPRMEQKELQKRPPKRCRFCADKITYIDYKDLPALQKLCTYQGKMVARKRSGNCSRHQRMTTTAIKRARFMALMPYIG